MEIRLLALPILADMANTTQYCTLVNGIERIWVAPYCEHDILQYVREAEPHRIKCQALTPRGQSFKVVTASSIS